MGRHGTGGRLFTAALFGAFSGASLFWAAVVAAAAAWAIHQSLWQERLVLDLVSRAWRYSHGTFPNRTSEEGRLTDFTGVALDLVVRQGDKGGEYGT